MISIFIDPRAKITYASFYMHGLYTIYGKRAVKFNMRYFKDLSQDSVTEDFDQYFAFVLVKNNIIKKRIIIDYRDKNNISKKALDWCDVYGKENYNSSVKEFTDLGVGEKKKIISIGPSFGIKIWRNPVTLFYLIKNYTCAKKYLPVSFRIFVSGYRWQMKRADIQQYNVGITNTDYIFFISSLYADEKHGPSTNSLRASFIRICKKTVGAFRGGLYGKKDNPNFEVYKDVITDEYIDANSYLLNIQKSLCVFNTPAVHGCHGWKLGEYMSMGKAIISMPFINEMPVKLVHARDIHFVKEAVDLEAAVKKIKEDDQYRLRLEKNARNYFETNLSPDVVITKLLGNQ